MQISARAQSIKPSATIAVTNRAAELKRQGKNIIGLGAGEPDFPTPEHIKQAGMDAIKANHTRYTAVDGIPELKSAIIDKFKRDNGLDYAPEQILVSCGGKQSFFNLALALFNKGDEAIIPAPYWVSYPDMCLIAEAKPVIVQTNLDAGFKLTPQQLEAAITPNTRLLVLNSPSNPTGVAYKKAELAALGEVLRKHPQVCIATDDMYEKILWADEPFCNLVNACPDLYPRTFVLNGVSKAYAMTGWRIGYAGGPAEMIKQMKKIQSQSTSNPCSISQYASVAALTGDQGAICEMVTAYKRRHDLVVSGLNSIKGVRCAKANGAFYAFPDMSEAIAALGMRDDLELAEHLLEKAEVALVPGSAFGSQGYMRLSFATSDELLGEALGRMAGLLGSK